MSLPDDVPNIIPRKQWALFVKGDDGEPNWKLIQDLEEQQAYLVVDVTAAVILAQATADAAALLAAAATTDLNAGTFLTVAAEAGLNTSRRIVAGTGLAATDAGAGSTYTLAISDQIVLLTAADVTNNAVAFADVTGMLGALAINSVYLVEALLTMQSAALTTGIGLTFTLPAGATISGAYDTNNTNNTAQQAFNIASAGISGDTTDVPVINSNQPIRGRWIIKTGATAGNAQLRFRSEVALSQVTIKKDLSVLIFRKIG